MKGFQHILPFSGVNRQSKKPDKLGRTHTHPERELEKARDGMRKKGEDCATKVIPFGVYDHCFI